MQEISRAQIGAKTKIVLRHEGEDGEPIFIKVHALRREIGFGVIDYKFTGAHCDSEGKALAAVDGHKILNDGLQHEEQINPHAPAAVKERFEAGVRIIAGRVAMAVNNERAAAPSSLQRTIA